VGTILIIKSKVMWAFCKAKHLLLALGRAKVDFLLFEMAVHG
jgi:hypothetical protein